MSLDINKIYNENCIDTLYRMPDDCIDLTVTSPPYDKLRDYKGFEFSFEIVARQLHRVTKDGGVVVWIVGDAIENGSETGTSFKQVLYFKELGFILHDTMIYLKAGFSFPDQTRYNPVFEFMFVLSKRQKPKTINLIVDQINKYHGAKIARLHSSRQTNGEIQENSAWRNNRAKEVKVNGVRDNVWYYSTGFGNSSPDEIAFNHPAIFPEQLAADHIYSWSNEGDLVYDPFIGSGTVAKMAHLQKRNWIGSEISSEYCQIAQKRIQPYLDQLTLI